MSQAHETATAARGISARTAAIAVACALVLLLVRVGWGQSRAFQDQTERGNRARSVYLVAYLYAEEHDHTLPALVAGHGELSYYLEGAHPAYSLAGKVTGPVSDPTAPLLLGDLNGYKAYTLAPVSGTTKYYYLGYALGGPDEAQAFAAIAQARKAQGLQFDQDLPTTPGKGSFGGPAFLRLRTDLAIALQAQGMTSDAANAAAARTPALIERPTPDAHSGAWVVYLDRHVEYIPIPGPFPMTDAVLAALDDLAK